MATQFIEKTVYFVRHGQSEGNISSKYQSPESPLSKEGKVQAKIVAERIKKILFDVLISSPLTRTKETTDEIIKITNKIPEYSNLFIERIKPTSINGKSSDDKESHATAKEWSKSLYTSGYKVEDGENFDDIIARADKALEFLLNRSEKVIVVVTHGYFLRTILARVLLGGSLTEDNFRNFYNHSLTENTGISAIRYNQFNGGEWHLWVYNDHAHLG